MRQASTALALLAGLLGTISLTGCGGRISVPQSPLLKYVERRSGLIALTGTDGNVHVMDQAGENDVALTADGLLTSAEDTDPSGPFAYYQLPVWSPDGTRLASLYYRGTDQRVEEVRVVAIPAKAGEPTTVFSSTSQAPSMVGWSPDSTRLVFLATSASGSSYGFYLVPAAGGEKQLLDAGVPYGWAWSPRGQELVIHAGSVAGGLASDRLAFLDVENGVLEEGLGLIAGLFETPAWSRDGRRVLVASWVDGRNRLYVTNRKRSEGAVLTTVDGPLAFSFAPGGDRVAYIAGSSGADGAGSELYVVAVPARLEAETASGAAGAPSPGTASPPESPAGRLLSGDDVVAAFFWSPDGSRIAYFVPRLVLLQQPDQAQSEESGEEGGASAEVQPDEAEQGQQAIALTLKIVDARTGTTREVSTFLPTPAFLSTIQRFTQLGQSVQIWSPDSRNVVYAGLDEQGPAIMVALSGESIAPRRIAGGLDATWSGK